MPKLARLDAPGIIHHIMVRGIERRKLLRDAKDRESFLERWGNLLLQTKTACYAWALLLRFWAVRELGVSLTDLARRLGMSPPEADKPSGGGICRAEGRGDGARARVPALCASGGLPHEVFTFLRACPTPSNPAIAQP